MRLLLGLAAALLLSAALTFIAVASSYPPDDPSSGDDYDVDVTVLQRTAGLTVKGGVRVNGNPAKTGLTIVSNSKIVTDSDGVALVELGPLGRIKIGEGTTVTLVFTRESVHVESECGRTRIEVFSGQVEVQSPRIETLGAGDSKRYHGSAKATSRGAVFEIRCLGGRLGTLRRTAGGILSSELVGGSGGGGGGETPPVLSVLQP
jgi:hypothetical protein